MKTKIRKYCFPQYFWLIIWTIPKNVNFDQKTAVRGAISQKEGIEILQDAPHIEAFWNPDQVVSSAFMEMKVTLEEGCEGLFISAETRGNEKRMILLQNFLTKRRRTQLLIFYKQGGNKKIQKLIL